MPDSTSMFQSLTDAERAAMPPAGTSRGAASDDWTAEPIPPSATPTFRHPKLGEPSAVWEYPNAAGEREGYQCRFDTTGPDGETTKEFRPLRWGRWTDKKGRQRAGWRWKGLRFGSCGC